jgi:phenylacetate-CoA ligase
VERVDVRDALLGSDESRIPDGLQYNPLENYIEVNDAGETVVTLNNSSVLAPKLRYNVGDEGLT